MFCTVDRRCKPELAVSQILAWADAHRQRTKRWPNCESGTIPGSSGETWRKVYNALRYGLRGLPAGYTLKVLLLQRRHALELAPLPPLTLTRILTWADAQRRRCGTWPTERSGRVNESPRENWSALDIALRRGHRGLPGRSSLANLLAEYRGVRNLQRLPHLTKDAILAWADAHFRMTGSWPNARSGEVAGAPGETWAAVDAALWKAQRGLRGGTSLARLLAHRRGVRNIQALAPLTIERILAWADNHYRLTGKWPKQRGGRIAGSAGETWSGIDTALTKGGRNLPGGSSLSALLHAFRFGKFLSISHGTIEAPPRAEAAG